MDKLEREAQLVKEFSDGRQAKSLLEHPAFARAVEKLETSYINAVRNGKWLDFSNGINVGKKAREENCRRLQVLDDLVTNLKNEMLKGEQALKRLEANNGNKQR